MSLDFSLVPPDGAKSLGDKASAREALLNACEKITGETIERRGPTEVDISPAFRYEVGFFGHRAEVEAIGFAFKLSQDSTAEIEVRRFVDAVADHTGWVVIKH
ncbi:MAG TPA: hypothetical protein DDW52_23860 [Planctomycetaceae bacterium]|nr:hypothetical protein [Planctomycetaceae bacterium]